MIGAMNAHLPNVFTLAAQDWQEVVGVAIGIVIFVGSMVASALKQSREQRRKAPPPGPVSTERPAREASQGIPTADELARRRQQLDHLMRRRRDAAQQTGGPPARKPQPLPEPDNLTVAEAQARQRAVEQYRRRAEELQRQREVAAARAQQERREMQRRRAQGAGQPPQPQTSMRASVAPTVAVAVEPEVTHRLVTEAAPIRQQTRRSVSPLAGLSLRRAVIAKEILDLPLALRQPPQS